MKGWSKGAIFLGIIFLILLVWFIFASPSQENNILNGSPIGIVLWILLAPGTLIVLFLAPASCRDPVSSFTSHISCPNLYYIELLLSYIIYLAIVIFIIWVYNKIKQRKE